MRLGWVGSLGPASAICTHIGLAKADPDILRRKEQKEEEEAVALAELRNVQPD